MRRSPNKMMVLLGDLEEHSVREVCQGAAEYAAARPDVDFDPWSIYLGRTQLPTPADLNRIDGLLLAEATLRLLGGSPSRLKVPHVFYLANEPHPASPSVELDEQAIGHMAAAHLLHRGYRHLAFFGCGSKPWSRQRGEGFRQTAQVAQVAVRQFECSPEMLPAYRSHSLHRREPGLRNDLNALPFPCGVFAANDVIACYIIQAARESGLRVPEQLGVIGVDDDPIPNAAAGLAISTIHVPFREAGRQAAAMLDQWMRTRAKPRRILLPPIRVVVRTSTNLFTVADALVGHAQAYIEDHRDERLSVAQVVRALRTTPVTLGKHFHHHLKMTPAQYIRLRRLEYARELLRAGDMNVAEVSEACHFHDCSYFCQVFRQTMGVSPGQLRPR
ncbi:MAG: substrate-binding domain-containing protein [Phycisphaeraceae bacterium]|nr:substrate-binding domain-containing protein [Phycisphaeraceae bacterium]